MVQLESSGSLDDQPASVFNRYQRCSMLNVIQHIDISGKYRSCYNERRKRNSCNKSSSFSQSFLNSSDSVDSVGSKISKFSIKTKVSAVYPGNERWSKLRRSSVNYCSEWWFSLKCLNLPFYLIVLSPFAYV